MMNFESFNKVSTENRLDVMGNEAYFSQDFSSSSEAEEYASNFTHMEQVNVSVSDELFEDDNEEDCWVTVTVSFTYNDVIHLNDDQYSTIIKTAQSY